MVKKQEHRIKQLEQKVAEMEKEEEPEEIILEDDVGETGGDGDHIDSDGDAKLTEWQQCQLFL